MKDSLKKLEKLMVPISIIIAGALVAGAVLYTDKTETTKNGNDTVDQQQGGSVDSKAYLNVEKVTNSDRIYGNKKAKTKVVIYTDLECPYCAMFHPAIKSVVDKSNGEIAMVMRYFPLSFHPQANEAIDTAECVFSKSGETSYWKFVEGAFDAFGSRTSDAKIDLSAVVVASGANKEAVASCVGKGAYTEKIQNDSQNAMDSGLQGTPFGVIIVNGEPKGTIDGALPEDSLSQLINQYTQ